VNGVQGAQPIPYKKTDLTPNLGVQDSSDDIRGGMGLEGLAALTKFVEQGGTLIVEGSTLELMPAYGIVSGVTIEEPTNLFVRGSILKAQFADKKSPIAYGYDSTTLPVYFSQGPVVSAGGGIPAEFRAFMGGGPQIPGVGMNITPNAQLPPVTTMEKPEGAKPGERPSSGEMEQFRQMARAFGVNLDERQPRVVLRFPTDPNDILLSGALAGGQALAGRAAVLDVPLGKGHIVMFAARPFWRSQTQGTYGLGFNAILNWNDLDAGKPAPPAEKTPTVQ
jgi:hypothetical protein